MPAWTNDERSQIAAADELQIATRRRDGTLRQPIPVWVVPHGDELYVRSVNGPAAAWYRGAQATHDGHIHAGGVAKDVTFVDADPSLADALEAAYRTKYRRYPTSVDHIVSPQARAAALKLVPRGDA
jgi:hypothetical protein